MLAVTIYRSRMVDGDIWIWAVHDGDDVTAQEAPLESYRTPHQALDAALQHMREQ